MQVRAKSVGAVATPREVARYLVDWAVREATDTILDIGVGKGVFLSEAFRALRERGATPDAAFRLLHGVESDPEIYEEAVRVLAKQLGQVPPGFHKADLFDMDFPLASAVIGNPPYVRRSALWEIDKIRNRLCHNNVFLPALHRLSDLYTYFVMYSSSFLKPGGRLALVLSSAWLDVDYGVELKRFLLAQYAIRGIVMFEGRVFPNALVKSVLLFAEKQPALERAVRFVRIPGPIPHELPAEKLLSLTPNETAAGVKMVMVHAHDLDPHKPWGMYLKTSSAYFSLVSRPGFTLLGKLAESRIGLQTLAGSFYVLSRDELMALGMPLTCVQPMAFGPRQVNGKVIRSEQDVRHYVFYVAPSNGATPEAASKYIQQAEKKVVRIRGKDEEITGYQNVPRIQQARRKPWYNLVTEIERRGRYPILLPRRCYESFRVIWNKAGVVANENFIELRPYSPSLTLALLAVLNASLFEIAVRSHAQLYGGGVYNLNPGDVRQLPVPDLGLLNPYQLRSLEQAYLIFAEDESSGARLHLDKTVSAVLDLSGRNGFIQETLAELKGLSSRAKEPVSYLSLEVGRSSMPSPIKRSVSAL